MKSLNSKQLDAKFAKAAKLAAELSGIMNELHEGCDTFKWAMGNSTGLDQRVRWVAGVLKNERELHKANK